jgi:hypothetical protein
MAQILLFPRPMLGTRHKSYVHRASDPTRAFFNGLLFGPLVMSLLWLSGMMLGCGALEQDSDDSAPTLTAGVDVKRASTTIRVNSPVDVIGLLGLEGENVSCTLEVTSIDKQGQDCETSFGCTPEIVIDMKLRGNAPGCDVDGSGLRASMWSGDKRTRQTLWGRVRAVGSSTPQVDLDVYVNARTVVPATPAPKLSAGGWDRTSPEDLPPADEFGTRLSTNPDLRVPIPGVEEPQTCLGREGQSADYYWICLEQIEFVYTDSLDALVIDLPRETGSRRDEATACLDASPDETYVDRTHVCHELMQRGKPERFASRNSYKFDDRRACTTVKVARETTVELRIIRRPTAGNLLGIDTCKIDVRCDESIVRCMNQHRVATNDVLVRSKPSG